MSENDSSTKQLTEETSLAKISELLFYCKNCLVYRKPTKIAVTIVEQPEVEGNFFQAHYTFINHILAAQPKLL